MNTPRRTVRVAASLWEAATAAAHRNGEDVSTVVRRALESYVREHPSHPRVDRQRP